MMSQKIILQRCVSENFQQKSDFVQSFNSKMSLQEKRTKGSVPKIGNKSGKRTRKEWFD